MIDSKACMTCKFFSTNDETDAASLGECHRFPPQTASVFIGYDEKKKPIFNRVITPNMTSPVGWCGEYILKIGS